MYNADLQCRLQFNTTDESVRVCSKMDEICSQLWCLVNDECVTQLRPAASGTNCGKHKVKIILREIFFEFVFSNENQFISVVSKSKVCSYRRSSSSNRWPMGKLD